MFDFSFVFLCNVIKYIKSYSYFIRLKSTKDLSDITPNISKEKWLRPDKSKKQKVLRNCESSVFQDMLINKCWPDQQLPLMYLDVDLDVLSDDGVELNLYPILRILENQRLRNQNDENILESEKQEVINTFFFKIDLLIKLCLFF